MNTDEKLDLLINEISSIKHNISTMQNDIRTMQTNIGNVQNTVSTMQTDISTMQTDISNMQDNISTMQNDINTLKRSALILENDIAPKVQLLLENHSELSKNVMVAKDIDERVGVLEFDVKMIKKLLQNKPA